MGERRRTPTASRWWPPTRRTGCATWCARPTRTCAAAASASRASRRRCRRGRRASASGSRPPRAPRWPSSAVGDGGGRAAIERSRLRDALDATAAGAPRPPTRRRGRGARKALCTRRLRRVPRRPTPRCAALARGRARAPRPHDAARAARALRRALRARPSASAPGSTSRTSSWSRATCSRATRACARRTRRASRTCSSTSSRTRTRSRTSCSSCCRGDNLFRVGDENQSIYRFRNADVGVFREHRAEAREDGRAESITVNFRARGEMLDAIDLAFERTWGERFEPLREAPGAREPAAAVDPCVELLVVDRAATRWERADRARRLLRRGARTARRPGARPRRACWRSGSTSSRATGRSRYGDVVMLFRATTAMGFFERALEERGIPVHVVGGRGYWGQQQVADLRHWLAALANPLDGLARLLGARLAARRACRSTRVALIGLHARRARGATPGGRSREPAERAGRRAARRRPAAGSPRSSSASRPSAGWPARCRSRR